MVLFLASLFLVSCSVESSIDVSRGWRFTTGDDQSYKNIDCDDSRWFPTDLPARLSPDKKRYVFWLRKKAVVPDEYRGREIAISLGKIWDADETYFNGVKIGESGSEPPNWQSMWNYDRYYHIPSPFIRYGDVNVIAVRMYTNTLPLFNGRPFIAVLEQVRVHNFWKRFAAEYLVVAFNVISLFLSLVSLVQYFSFRRDRVSLLYSIITFILTIASFQYYLPASPMVSATVKDIVYYTLMTTAGYLSLFLFEMFSGRRHRVVRVIMLVISPVSYALILTSSLDDPLQGWRFDIIGMILNITLLLLGYIVTSSVIRERSRESIAIVIGYLVLILCCLNDIFFMMNLYYSDFFLIPYGWVACYITIGIALAFRTSRTMYRNWDIENHMEIARLIQQKLLPQSLPDTPGYRAHAAYVPMDKVGGDFYDITRYGDAIRVFIADVSGHGLASSYLAMIARMSLESVSGNRSTGAVIKHINEAICRSTVKNNYVTSFYAEIDLSTNVIRYTNAGQFPPLVYRAGTGEFFELMTRGRPLGWFLSLLVEEKSFQLSSGDRLILFTDGIIECANRKGEMFGEERFREFIRSHGQLHTGEFADRLLSLLKEHRGTGSFDDDVTLIVLDVL